MTIVSRGGLEALGTAQYGLTPVGTGPFKVTEHQLGQGVTLEKFADYYDPERPKLDKITITPVDGVEPLAAAMEAGDVQYIGGNPVPAQLVDRFKANPDLSVDVKPGPGFQSVWLNPWRDYMKVTDFNKPLDELKKEKGFMVRLALAKALDRDLFIKQARSAAVCPRTARSTRPWASTSTTRSRDRRNRPIDPEGAQGVDGRAGYPGRRWLPDDQAATTPNTKRDGQVVANILKQVLGINVTVDAEGLLGRHRRIPEDGLRPPPRRLGRRLRPGRRAGRLDADRVEVQRPEPRQGRRCPSASSSEAEADALIDAAIGHRRSARHDAIGAKGQQDHLDKVACGFLYHPVDVQVHSRASTSRTESRIPGLHELDRVTLA